jgi:uncharacterized membrane protein
MRRWLIRIGLLLMLAVAFHMATVMLYPTGRLLALSLKGKREGRKVNRIYHAPRVTAASRHVVRPSPDLLYSICSYDVSEAPLRITASVPDTYWSLSLYASNTDNFFVINDRQVLSKKLEMVLVGPDSDAPEGTTARVVVSPSDRGVALIRTLITDEATVADLQHAQRQARCESLNRAGPALERAKPGT